MAMSFPAFRRFALGLCRRCGIRPCDVEDVAATVMQRVWRKPARLRHRAAAETIRRCLARQMSVPRRSLPADVGRLNAIGSYSAAWRVYAEADGAGPARWQAAFDHNSRRFAIENGVCPRCSRPGEFAESAGRCECGFAYGDAE